MTFKKMFSGIQLTMIFSLIFHFLLATLLFFMSTGFDFSNQEFSEVAFISTSRPIQSESVRQPSATTETQDYQPDFQTGDKEILDTQEPSQSQQQAIQLPKRRMLEDDTEPIQREITKITPTPSTRIPVENETQYHGQKVTAATLGEKITAGISKISPDGKQTAPSTEFAREEQAFYIEGDAADRKIIKKVIPDYPAGLQKEATVKVRFTVLPDGRVGEMIPLQKGGDATLEQITMNALQQWRFNTLSPSAPQINVQGIITFNYLLR